MSLTAYAEEAAVTVRVGWVTHPGLQNEENGVYSGYTYDYLMKVAEYTGWQYEFVSGDLTDCLAQLKAGKIDLVGGLLYSEERARHFDFPQNEYGRTYKTLFTSQNSDRKAYDFESFDGIEVGMIKNATVNHEAFDAFAKENGFTYSTVLYSDIPSLNTAVLSGEVDAGILGAYKPVEGVKVLADFSPSPLYFAVTRGKDEVLVGLNRTINRIQIDDPYLAMELYHKHFAVPKSLKLTDAETELVNASKNTPIKLGIINGDAPTTYWDNEKGEFVGIYMDLIEKISEYTGLQFEYAPVDLTKNTAVGYIKDGALQVVAGMLKTEAFASDKRLLLSDTLNTDALTVVSLTGHDFTNNPKSKTIAVMKGFKVSMEYVSEHFPEHNVVEYNTLAGCMDAVVKGDADAAVHLESCIKHLLQNPHYINLDCNTTFTTDVRICIIANADGNDELISVINKGLAMISDKEHADIVINFTTMNPYHMTLSDTVYKYRVPLIAISILIVVVITALAFVILIRRQAEKKTQEALQLSEAANTKMNEALILAEQASAAKGSFMSRMSHEIRTPLNAIIGYNIIAGNDIAEAKTDTDYRQAVMKVADCLTKSDIASKHLLTIVNDVLDMSAIESGKIQIAHERFDFKGLINSLRTIFYSQAKAKGVEFEVVFDTTTEEWFVGDQMRTSQVLTNVLSNAVKFTQDGGKVMLSIRQELIDSGARIHFKISDTGIGMAPEYVSHIWTPFEQADASIARRFGGTGLGLSITKNLVDLMGGSIEVESRLGVGSSFKIDLPFERTEQPSNTGTFDFSIVNALVVDDDVSTCDYIQLLMNRFGARCHTVTSGFDAVDAVEAAQNNHEPYTVCLVDWRMPKMDGLETIKRIREVAGNEIPIIVISAYDFSEIVEKAAEAGVTKFISKPLFQSSLFELLANICGVQAETKHEKVAAANFEGVRVLLAEDNAMNMEIARHILESAGFTVDSAWNGQEAVTQFEASSTGTYSAILMDIQMPVMDGHLAARTIRASAHPEAKSIPIIAMTADAFSENVAEALASGMNGHIAKPIDIPTLFETLGSVIGVKSKEYTKPSRG